MYKRQDIGVMDVAYDYDVAMTIKATGNSVKITYPDFSGYQEIDPNAMPELAAEPTPDTAVEAQKTVYITKTGKRYHYDDSCNGGTYYESTLEEALNRGLTPCEKCVA